GFANKLIKTTPEAREQPSDFVEPMDYVLTLLRSKGIRATFFFLFHTARKYRETMRRVLADGHEVALHGDGHENVLDLGEEGFRQMLVRMRSAFKDEFGADVCGYRAPNFGMSPAGLSILAQE